MSCTSLMEMWGAIEHLKDPNLVACVQRYFGVQPVPKSNYENSSNGSSPNDPNNTVSTQSETKKYNITNRWWYIIFLVSTHLGDELFYALFFSFMFWNVDAVVARSILLIWCISLSSGQAMKDYIKWPRPPYPPVYCLQKKWAQEYGMPSTHAVIGVTIPFSLLYFSSQRYQCNISYGIFLALLFCGMVCLSRLYLGMHSVLDIVAGLILGAFFLLMFLPLPELLDQFLLTNPWSPVTLLLVSSLCVALYPSSIYSLTRQDTAVVLGATAGLYIGLWTSHHLNPVLPLPSNSLPVSTLKNVGLAVERTVIGCSAIFIFRTCFKSAYRFILSLVSGPKMSAPLFLVLSFYYVLYFMVGFHITFLIPHLFRYLGIERSSYLKEI
ncbi:unnamed protein product [Bemisia tabaci]|uniref:Phosphatidic acid phosphatase type 2/haloperoxidase domain-containing protein n=1 Tax=Bemisia tabaci TaxID=7038 RepID=A0A9P0F9K7_BEMTA|nr:unnamed protein product [Bemisia tabaci]